jgi:hypothetical protein
MITPTVGRIVHYHPRPGEIEAGTIPDPMGQPCAAQIARVNDDGTVNLGVLDARGNAYARRDVPLIQEGESPPELGDYCEWMPYQKDVAAGKIAPTLHAKPNTTGL